MAHTPHRPRTPASYELPISPKSAKGKHPAGAFGQFFVTEVERQTRRRQRLRSCRLTQGPSKRVHTSSPPYTHRRALQPAPPLPTARPGAHSSGPPGAPHRRTGARGAGRPTWEPGYMGTRPYSPGPAREARSPQDRENTAPLGERLGVPFWARPRPGSANCAIR